LANGIYHNALLNFLDKEGNPIDSRAIVVEANQTVPITKILTFKKSEDFEIKVF
jgi:uncharacterized lipoprotein NlpE involved in copper resistance